MTAKRYHKLFRAYMTEIMSGHPKAGKCIYAAAHAKPNFGPGEVFKSYQDALDSLMETINPNTYKIGADYIAKYWSSGRR